MGSNGCIACYDQNGELIHLAEIISGIEFGITIKSAHEMFCDAKIGKCNAKSHK